MAFKRARRQLPAIPIAGVPASDLRFRNALFHLLVSQTSCYRYWGQGAFVDYGREICRRGIEILTHDF